MSAKRVRSRHNKVEGYGTVFDGTYRTVPPFAVIAFFSSVLFLGSNPKIETSTPLRQSPPSWLSPFFLVAIVTTTSGTRTINKTKRSYSIRPAKAATTNYFHCLPRRPTTSTHAGHSNLFCLKCATAKKKASNLAKPARFLQCTPSSGKAGLSVLDGESGGISDVCECMPPALW